jgi:hypothetical protein
MRVLFVVMLASGLCLAGCGQAAESPSVLENPAGPTVVTGSGTAAASTSAARTVELPFHSEVIWDKTMNQVPEGHCTRTLPGGLVYKWLTHNEGTHLSTHLGSGAYENYLCVFGPAQGAPTGWYAEVIRWTAANGDVLLGTSEFQRWTGTPGRSIAVEIVTFHDGGTGRFQFAEGDGMSGINAPERTAVYDGTLRYGKKQK